MSGSFSMLQNNRKVKGLILFIVANIVSQEKLHSKTEIVDSVQGTEY